MKPNLFIAMAATLISATMLTGCKTCRPESQTAYDYSSEANWMVKDYKEKDVDVFYIYPTVVMSGNSPAAAPDSAEKQNA